MLKRLAAALALSLTLTVALVGPACAADAKDPGISEIYRAAEAGRMKDAEDMIAKVLQDHPASAKAHFVHAELLLKAGKVAAARSELARAEELAPGLPFAKPDSVASLRRSFEAAAVSGDKPRPASVARPMAAELREPVKAAGGLGLLPIAALGFGVLALVVFLVRRPRPAATPMPMGQTASGPGNYAAPSYAGGYGGAPQPAPGAPGPQWAPGAQGAPAAGGLMGGLGGALMTGAAVGLGAAAVGAAVRHFSQPDDRTDGRTERDVATGTNQQPAFANDLGPAPDRDLGGNDFGITDTSSWDSPSSDSSGGDSGGTDWDS